MVLELTQCLTSLIIFFILFKSMLLLLLCKSIFPSPCNNSAANILLYKVTRKNGKIGISDIVVRNEIPLHLRDALSRFLCVLEAKSEQEYKGYLENAGFRIHKYTY